MITGSKKQILDLLKSNGILSIDEITDGLKLAKTTLREHLLQLERDNYIKRRYERSGPGRPSLQYTLTPHGHSTYPSGESKLMRNFLAHMKLQGNESAIEDFFKKFWENRFEKASRMMNEQPAGNRKARVESLMKMLSEEGFMPEYELDKTGNKIEIRECNCPYREVVKETRLLCQLEKEFYKRLFGGEVSRTSYIAEGDYSCSYSIYTDSSK